SDTMACIAGAIAEAFYGGVPPPIREESGRRLPPALRATVTRFLDEFIPV
ncbi:MAG: ADP-ribosylglycohydrolase family protein, partial [Gammaproteobacteria bacterium]|nr:ADP-ribosylglycohydrolase family protein [Gammaproteobacteria bacterium]